jgi:hypothetical protein
LPCQIFRDHCDPIDLQSENHARPEAAIDGPETDDCVCRPCFFQSLRGSKNKSLSHGEAPQQAEFNMLNRANNNGDAHPRVWAPFVVVGDPPGLLQARSTFSALCFVLSGCVRSVLVFSSTAPCPLHRSQRWVRLARPQNQFDFMSNFEPLAGVAVIDIGQRNRAFRIFRRRDKT